MSTWKRTINHPSSDFFAIQFGFLVAALEVAVFVRERTAWNAAFMTWAIFNAVFLVVMLAPRQYTRRE